MPKRLDRFEHTCPNCKATAVVDGPADRLPPGWQQVRAKLFPSSTTYFLQAVCEACLPKLKDPYVGFDT